MASHGEERGPRNRARESYGAGPASEDPQRRPDATGAAASALFREHRAKVMAVMARRGIRRLVAFGSRARGDHSPESDLDLAVEMEPTRNALGLLGAEADLEAAIGLSVRLVEMSARGLAAAIKKDGVEFIR